MKKLRYLHSNKGMSLIEAMIITTVISLLMVGLSNIYSGMAQRQRLTEANAGLLEFSLGLQKILSDESSWATTIRHASNSAIAGITCLQDATPNCANNTTGVDFNVMPQTGAAYYLAATPTSGIDMTGATCNTYPSLACPFRFNLTALSQCLNGAANCAVPQVTIIGNLIIAPAFKNTDPILRKIDDRALTIAPPPFPPPAVPQASLSFKISHGQKSKSETFELFQLSDNTGTTGGGNCLPLGWKGRPLSNLNDNSNIVISLSGAGVFTLSDGNYECTVSAQGYDQPSGFKIRISNLSLPGINYPIGSGVTDDDASTIVFGKVNFALHSGTTTNLALEHYCASDANTGPPNSAMGIPIAPFAQQTVYTRIFCTRTH
jgi:Tfp pilus assembly protein PilE